MESIEAADERYLTFWVKDKLCGLPIAHVVQILEMQPITPVPGYPAYAKGVMDLRNQIVPVVDLRLRFGKEAKPYDDRTCILIHQHQSLPVGLIIDRVERVVSIPEVEIQPPADSAKDTDWFFSWGMGQIPERQVLLMDVDKVIQPDQQQPA